MTTARFPTTGIGSLPHHNIDAALAFSFQATIPFLPQIPIRNPWEYMIAQALEGVPGLEVETGSYSRIGARNLRRLLRREVGLVGTHDPPAQAKPILLPKSDRDELGPRPWLDIEALHGTVGRLYPLYREPSRHVTALVASGVL